MVGSLCREVFCTVASAVKSLTRLLGFFSLRGQESHDLNHFCDASFALMNNVPNYPPLLAPRTSFLYPSVCHALSVRVCLYLFPYSLVLALLCVDCPFLCLFSLSLPSTRCLPSLLLFWSRPECRPPEWEPWPPPRLIVTLYMRWPFYVPHPQSLCASVLEPSVHVSVS